jgi:hypothetical protein
MCVTIFQVMLFLNASETGKQSIAKNVTKICIHIYNT